MRKPEFSRPFNILDAKAGAPYCCRDGRTAQVLKWDRNVSDYPLLGVVGKSDDPRTWVVTGASVYGAYGDEYDCDLVMLPLGMCQSKPVFMGDELVTRFGDKFVVEAKHIGDLDEENTWPPSYPVTQMRLEDFDAAIIASGSKECISASAACAIANTALRHSIDAGQVVPSDVLTDSVRKAYADGQAIAYKHEAGGRAARDLAVAVAVNNAAAEIALKRNFVFALDLAAIIARVTGAKDAQPIDCSIEKGDMVYRKTWGGGKEPVEVVNVNWALKAIAVKLSPTGGTVVWPVEGMTKERFSDYAKEGAK